MALAVPGSASAAACAEVDAQPGTPAFEAHAATTTLCLLNNERAAHGLAPLRPGPGELAVPAVEYARDMVGRKFFGHVSPEGITLTQRLASYATGDSWAIGENLAWGEAELGSPAAIVRAWMDSPGHRRNILDGTYQEIGIGIAPGAPQTVSRPSATFVTEFGSRANAPEPTDSELEVDVEPEGDEEPATRSVAARNGTAADRTAGKATTKKKAASAKKRCRTVTRKVRRKGKLVRIKRTVCTPKKTTASKKTAAKTR